MNEDAMNEELGWTPLHRLAEKADAISIKILLAQGTEIDATDIYNRTPLSIAASKGNLQLVQLLVNAGADVDLGFPLHYACEKGHISTISFLIKSGASVNLERDNNYPLLIAARNGNLEASKILIENGANIDVVDDDKETALHWACDSGNEKLISLLIDCGCDVNMQDRFHMTPLSICLVRQQNRPDLAKLLLMKGASINRQDEDDYSYLHSAENPESVLELIKHGAGVNAQNIDMETPLYLSVFLQTPDCARCLLQQGADPNIAAQSGWTPLHVAAAGGSLETVTDLLKRKANVNCVSVQNILPLHLAACNGFFEIVKELVGGGSLLDVPILDLPEVKTNLPYFINPEFIVDGATPLSLAASKGNLEICKFLASRGAQCDNISGIPEEVLQFSTSPKKIRDWPEIKLLNLIRSYELDEAENFNLEVVDSMGWTPLHHAVDKGFYDTCYSLMQKGSSVNALDKYQRTPLSVAAARNQLDILNLLLDNGADLNLGRALHFAFDGDSNGCLKELLLRGCDVNMTDNTEEKQSVLIKAVASSKKDVVEMLLKHGANPNLGTKWEQTPLFKACFLGNVEIVQLLLQHGASVNAIDSFKQTALFRATFSKNVDVIKLLLQHGADVNVENDFQGTALHNAILEYFDEAVTELIKAGASVNSCDAEGETPLFIASENPTILRALLREKVDVNYRKSGGWTPLHETCRDGNVKCVQELLQSGLNVNSASAECVLPIYLAAIGGDVSIVEELLNCGAYVDPYILDIGVIRDDSGNFPLSERYHIVAGNTPLIGAASKGHLEVVKLLKSKGANLGAVNCNGNTALHEAVFNGFDNVVEYLLSVDANLNLRNREDKTALDLAKDQENVVLIQLLGNKIAD